MENGDTKGGCFAASVIIPVHNAQDSIGEQLDALAAQETDVNFEVVVVLNRCTDRSGAVVEGFRDELDIRVIDADEQASAAYARNIGARHSLAPLLLFCDADDRAGAHWVSALHESLQTADFVGGRLVIDLENLPRWRQPATRTNPVNGGLHSWDARILYPITASLGCRRVAFLEVGGFDESFAAAAEDADIALSLYRAGYRMAFAPAAEMLYRPRRTLRQMLRQSRTYAQGHALLAAKEGRLIPVGGLRGFGQLVLTVTDTAITKRTVSPRSLFFAGAKVRHRLDAWRSVAAMDELGPQGPNPIVDYGVAVRSPVASWFSLSDHRDRARQYFSEQPDADVLDLIAARVQAGDTMIDLEPNGGAVAITAAWAVGAGGSVWTYEPLGPRRQLLQQNAVRHGCEEIIRIVRTFDFASLPVGVALVRFDRKLRALGSPDNYRRLIDKTPQAAYIVPSKFLGGGNHDAVTDQFFSSRWRLTRLTKSDVTPGAEAHLSDGVRMHQSNPGSHFLAERSGRS